jgi:phosphoglycolate phosphatase
VIPAFPVYLFDIDGTLLDSAADLCGAVRQVVSKHLSEVPPPEYFRRFIGYHLDEFFLDVLPHFNRQQLDELIVEWRSVYPARGHAATTVYPGVAELLARLPGRKTTATTKGTASARAVLGQFGLLPFFDHVQGTDGFGYKPKPDVVLKAMEALDVKPDDCLLVGDSETDMEAGRRAGVRICAVRYGYGDPAALAKWEPDYWISSLTELAE